MESSLVRIELLLIVASIVAIAARKIRIPYTVGLVFTGWILAFYSVAPNLHLTKDLVYGALLPPLIFEAAFHIRWKELRPELAIVILLATIGVAAAAGLTFLTVWLGAGVRWETALIIGVVLSATDPVSVLALLKNSGLSGRVKLLVESESLFNDGTAAVLFSLALLLIAGESSVSHVGMLSVVGIFGGLIIGALAGFACLLLAGRTEDHLIEITATTIAAAGSFAVAEHFHASGVLATLVAGLILGNLGHFGAITPKGREATVSFWEYAGFVANSLIFLLIGIDLPGQHLRGAGLLIVWTIVGSVLGRAVAVYPGCFIFKGTSRPIPSAVQHLLFWGGLRGALGLALVLGLPSEFPDRQLILTAVFYAVAFSVIVQGLTVSPVIQKIKRDENFG